MSAKLGGRKPKSHVVGAKIVFYLPLYLVLCQSVIADGAKRTFHDGQGLHRLTETTTSHGIIIHKEEFARYKEHLSEFGYGKIRAKQMRAELPRYCPKCLKPNGYPHMRLYQKVASDRNKTIDTLNHDLNSAAKTKIKYEVYYSHSKPELHQCHIGYWTPAGYELAGDIDHQRMSPCYIVKQNGGFMEFDVPDKKMKLGKTLT